VLVAALSEPAGSVVEPLLSGLEGSVLGGLALSELGGSLLGALALSELTGSAVGLSVLSELGGSEVGLPVPSGLAGGALASVVLVVAVGEPPELTTRLVAPAVVGSAPFAPCP
jgi:hypothetical protein